MKPFALALKILRQLHLRCAEVSNFFLIRVVGNVDLHRYLKQHTCLLLIKGDYAPAWLHYRSGQLKVQLTFGGMKIEKKPIVTSSIQKSACEFLHISSAFSAVCRLKSSLYARLTTEIQAEYQQ
ncbi:hypothetical protein D3C86_1140930 [compost metagenome]